LISFDLLLIILVYRCGLFIEAFSDYLRINWLEFAVSKIEISVLE